MAPISAVSEASTLNSADGSISSAGKLDMNAFLTMFTTQLKYQDPTNPLESYELAAQLAQFSTVEKLTEANKNLVTLQSYLASINNAQMVEMIGRTVVGNSNTITVDAGKVSDLKYELSTSGEVTIKISDAEGKLVRTIKVGAQDAGKHSFTWDGKNDAGETVSSGKYTAEVSLLDANGNTTEVETTVEGKVYSFRLEEGLPYLILGGSNGIALPISQILEVMGQKEDADNG